MIITRTQIERMRRGGRMHITAELEEMILARYGVEPEPHEYTEQDLHEQIRKLVAEYNDEHPDPTLKSPILWERTRPTPEKPTTLKGAKISN